MLVFGHCLYELAFGRLCLLEGMLNQPPQLGAALGALLLCNGWLLHLSIDVLFGCFARKIDGPGLPWWFNHLPGPSISPTRTPLPLSRVP